ncbi:MAG: Dyp-type peroxidase [Corynebacterium sp.]|nr:Dyp-type peroxidase [Corynebacterium sp.]
MTSDVSLGTAQVPFDGPVQAGVATMPPAHLNEVGFNFEPGVTRDQIIDLMQRWTAAARALTCGQEVDGFVEPEMTAITANLTITFGVGEGFLTAAGVSSRTPSWLHPIPAFTHDVLQTQWGQTDMIVQFNADDLVPMATALRRFVYLARGIAHVVWEQQGFGHAAGTQKPGTTPRNPMGQIDGTVNPRTAEEFAEQVWIDAEEPYLKNSTAMVIRRIAIDLDAWHGQTRPARERVIGRRLDTGAPLSGGESEFDEEDMDAVGTDGAYLIDRHSHLALSREQDGLPSDALKRRAYSYQVFTPGSGPESGFVWVAFQKDPDRQFTAIQRRLDESDLLNPFITHIGSAVYWIVPGTTPDTYWAQDLLAE